MNKLIAVLAVLAACGSPATVAVRAPAPVPVQTAAPAPVPEPVVVVPPAVPAAPSSEPPQHVKVVIPAELVYWVSVDQRFSQDLVAGQPVLVNAVCNPDQPFPFNRTVITKGDGSYLDFGSCKSVSRAVVDEWFYAWNKIARANPGFSPKQIQDAISAGAY